MSEKKDFIKRLTDKGMSLSDATEEWGIHLRELDAYEDRIALRAENNRLKNPQKFVKTTEEEECLTCSA